VGEIGYAQTNKVYHRKSLSPPWIHLQIIISFSSSFPSSLKLHLCTFVIKILCNELLLLRITQLTFSKTTRLFFGQVVETDPLLCSSPRIEQDQGGSDLQVGLVLKILCFLIFSLQL